MPKKPESDVTREEAAANAELTAEHAVRATRQAEEAERELAEASKEDPKSRLCPHCNTEMKQHSAADPIKAGAWHCDGCGCCFKGRSLREGHAGCPASAGA